MRSLPRISLAAALTVATALVAPAVFGAPPSEDTPEASAVREACLAAAPAVERPDAVCDCIADNLAALLGPEDLRAVAGAYAGRPPPPGEDRGDAFDIDLTTAERCLQEPRYRVPGARRPAD